MSTNCNESEVTIAAVSGRDALTRAYIAEGRVKELEHAKRLAFIKERDEAMRIACLLQTAADLASDLEVTVAGLEAENDGLRKRNERQATTILAAGEDIRLLRLSLEAKDARIAELKSALADRSTAFKDPDEKPEPVHNPFREYPRDPRRMGPL